MKHLLWLLDNFQVKMCVTYKVDLKGSSLTKAHQNSPKVSSDFLFVKQSIKRNLNYT